MSSLADVALSRLSLLARKQRRRALVPTEREEGVFVRRGGRRLVSFSGNDYLGLAAHPAVAEAAREAITQYGAGAGASRLVTGDHPLYAALEAELAAMKGAEAALVFGSGYLANIGVIPALVEAGDLILADRLSHACMLDGARLSGAGVMRFSHNGVEHCRALLEAHRAEHAHCLILTETVFSMDGDRAPVAELAALAREFDAWLMTDDAHGLGIPPTGMGYADVMMGTLSKAAGVYGGYVCGEAAVIDYLRSCARSLMFSTALPPALLAASLASLRIMRAEPERGERALSLARKFTGLMELPLAESAVVPLVLGEEERALAASAMLEENGFLAVAIRPPAVPPGKSRLRFAFSALHAEEQVERVAALLRERGFSCAS